MRFGFVVGTVALLLGLPGCAADQRVPLAAGSSTPSIVATCGPAREPASVVVWSCTIPAGADALVSELSGLYYDKDSSTLWAVSDNTRSSPDHRARLLQFDLSGAPGLALRGVRPLTREAAPVAGRVAPDWDLEGLAPVIDAGRWTAAFFVASEDDEGPAAGASQIYLCTAAGACSIAFGMPSELRSASNGQAPAGIAVNQGIEGLTVSPDGARVFAALEQPLIQEVSADGRRGRVRLIEFDRAQFSPVRQYTYELDARPQNVSAADGAPGVSEILSVSSTELLLLERSYSSGCGNTIRLFGVTLDPALALPSGQPIAQAAPLRKRLLIDFTDEKSAFDDAKLASALENFEGMSLGPNLPDGSPTLLLVSDDNQRSGQITALVSVRLASLPTAAARRWQDGDPPVCPMAAG
jgi:hypothetical protein